MKKIFFLQLLLLGIDFLLFISCKKDTSCEDCRETNSPPIAIAGSDQVITLPTDSISLDGSASNDPDGKISEWLWTKISGPASFDIVHSTDSVTWVKALVPGIYQFELSVKDNGRLLAKDTIQVTVDAGPTNHLPIANAGSDTVITLPANTINLDGSRSTDPDNNIVGYVWTKISGPSAFNIANANAVQSQVTNLVAGIYQFELKVTDAGGLVDKDTVQLTVNDQSVTLPACDGSQRSVVSARLMPIGTLSQSRLFGISIAAGGKIIFVSSRVDIYDLNTGTWSTAERSVARGGMSTVIVGNKIFFAGGAVEDNEGNAIALDDVDIYDVSANTWTTSHLSLPGYDITGGTVGNKVLFAGGFGGGHERAKRVDFYDLTTGSWTTDQLSEPQGGMTAVAINNKIYFAGGLKYDSTRGGWLITAKINIYDNATNMWTISAMQMPRSGQAAISVGSKIYWAGGDTAVNGMGTRESCNVEIRDVTTGNSSIQYLSKPSFPIAVVKNNKIIFCRNRPFTNSSAPAETNKFDIYDINTGSWSVGVLNQPIPFGASIISANNIIYVAGGAFNVADNGAYFNFTNQVWTLEF